MKPLFISLFKPLDAVKFTHGKSVYLVQSIDGVMVQLEGFPGPVHENTLSLVESLSSPSIKSANAIVSKAERHAERVHKRIEPDHKSVAELWRKGVEARAAELKARAKAAKRAGKKAK